jgi:hypothetical protein
MDILHEQVAIASLTSIVNKVCLHLIHKHSQSLISLWRVALSPFTLLSAYSHETGPVKPTDRHRAAVLTGGHIEKGNAQVNLYDSVKCYSSLPHN